MLPRPLTSRLANSTGEREMRMSAVDSGGGTHPAGQPPQGRTTAVPLLFTQSDSFVAVLNQLGASLWLTTYQAQQLLVLRPAGGGLSMLVRTFDKPMGLAVDGRRLALGTRDRVWLFRNAPDIAAQLQPPGQHDACYLPRSCHVTGDIAGHELAWVDDDLWIVNSRFSCLCTLHGDYSFVPRWQPPFLTTLAAEDRCHLNGLALGPDGDPATTPAGAAPRPTVRYVSALGETDTRDGWRPNKAQGGCLLEVPGGRVVARGLSMPHSPRLHQGKLWLLESGTGQLLQLDPMSGRRETVAELPGYTRGLALAGPYAFVGLSRIRETSTFGGLPIAQRRAQLKCGVGVVDCRRGQLMALLEFQTAIEEIFDVQLLPGARFPEVVGFQKDTVQHTFVVPPAAKVGGLASPPVS
jgi:uncharacterized protein (TIGR03032 family)